MIGIRDTLTLAFTKLRAKPLRLVTTALLAGLLFGVLVAASLVTTGAFRSADSFREDGLTGRHIVAVDPVVDPDGIKPITRNPELIAEVKLRYERIVEEKIIEAERLGIHYTQASESLPYSKNLEGIETLNFRDSNGITFQLLDERLGGTAALNSAALNDTARKYGAIDTFEGEYFTLSTGSALIPLDDGKESFTEEYSKQAISSTGNAIEGTTFVEPNELTKDFMLPNNGNWQPDNKTLPIILPRSKVEQLLNMSAPNKDAAPREKMQYLMQLHEKAENLTVRLCYRNESSLLLIQQTIGQQKEIKAGEGNKDYLKPTVIYKLPDANKCENPQIASDTRTAEEKLQADNQAIFDKRFNLTTDPKSYFVTFEVVGISSEQSHSSNNTGKLSSLSDVIDNLLATSSIGQSIPRTLYEQIPNKEAYADIFGFQPIRYMFGNGDTKQRYIEFATATDAQRFIREQGCTVQMDGKCRPSDRIYQLRSAFSNSAAIDDAQDTARQWFYYGAISIAVLAVIIMWIAVGRTMTDGRRETAVFRAVGFTRSDIAAVYLCYTMLLVMLIGLLSFVIGFAAAYTLDATYAPDLTVQAQYRFGALDPTKEVSLVGVDYQQLGLVLAACVATGIVSVIIPLLRNVRRNPLRDMRDE